MVRDEIQQAQLEVFIEQTKQGLLKVVESRIDAITARILADVSLPAPLPWKYTVSAEQWFDLYRGDVRSVLVVLPRYYRDPIPPAHAEVHLFCEARDREAPVPIVVTVRLARRITDVSLLLHLEPVQ